MFYKTIVFEDFNGNPRSQDFYFHMSKAELLSMAAAGNEMTARLQRIIDSKDGRAILQEFRTLIEMSVGVRSEDGSRFIKDADAKSSLMDSPAFDVLLMELSTNANASIEFVTQLIPEKMQKEMQKQLAEGVQVTQTTEKNDENIPEWVRENREPTQKELQSMTQEELILAFQERAKRKTL